MCMRLEPVSTSGAGSGLRRQPTRASAPGPKSVRRWVSSSVVWPTDRRGQRRCRTVLQSQADAFTSAVQTILQPASYVDAPLALV
jgi:hypothetical protein